MASLKKLTNGEWLKLKLARPQSYPKVCSLALILGMSSERIKAL